ARGPASSFPGGAIRGNRETERGGGQGDRPWTLAGARPRAASRRSAGGAPGVRAGGALDQGVEVGRRRGEEAAEELRPVGDEFEEHLPIEDEEPRGPSRRDRGGGARRALEQAGLAEAAARPHREG